MLILGTTASSILKVSDTGAMFPLQVITVGPAGASSVSFTNIPNTYTHLQVRILARRSTGTDVGYDVFTSMNSDTNAANYYSHYLFGNGSSVGAGANANRYFGAVPGTAISNTFGGIIMDFLDYANTNKYKTGRLVYGHDQNGSGYSTMQSMLWNSTSAITSLSFTLAVGGSFAEYSHFALYGIKGA